MVGLMCIAKFSSHSLKVGRRVSLALEHVRTMEGARVFILDSSDEGHIHFKPRGLT